MQFRSRFKANAVCFVSSSLLPTTAATLGTSLAFWGGFINSNLISTAGYEHTARSIIAQAACNLNLVQHTAAHSKMRGEVYLSCELYVVHTQSFVP